MSRLCRNPRPVVLGKCTKTKGKVVQTTMCEESVRYEEMEISRMESKEKHTAASMSTVGSGRSRP